jgi:hypothetical protein
VALPDKPAPSTVLPSVRCTAHSKRTGEPCGNFATVCRLHGSSARHVRNAASARVTLATLLKSDPRPVWDVVLDAVATADALMTDLKLGITAGADDPHAEPLDPAQLSRLSDAVKLAHSLASSAITVRAYELKSQVAELDGERLADAVLAAVMVLLDALGIADPGDRAEVDAWLRRALGAALRGQPVPDPPLAALRGVHVAVLRDAPALTATPEPTSAAPATNGHAAVPWPAGAWSPANPPPPVVFDTTPEEPR